MTNTLAKKFSFFTLLQFALPTIVMMMFMSFYTMVDGIFVSRLIGTSALSAINIVYPYISFVAAAAIMLASGGSAVVATLLGENKQQKAKEIFSLLMITGIIFAAIIVIISITFLQPILRALGANDAIIGYCTDYARIIVVASPLAILQMMFQYFFVTAGKPQYGLLSVSAGGVANIILDYVFIAQMNMGIAGAALATGIGFSIPSIVGLLYFSLNKKGTLKFTRPKFYGKALLKSFTNGSSEMVTSLSMAVITFLFNLIMMHYKGEDGVAAITIVLYMEYLLTAVFLGYASGVSPVFSFNHGEGNKKQLKKLFRISMIFLISASLFICVAAQLISTTIVTIFVQPGNPVYDLANSGFKIFALAYLFMGTNIFASAMFTAFSNGAISALISFLRTFVFILVAFLTLPYFFDINGIWLAVPVAELLTIVISVTCFIRYRKEYHYA